jgi:excisionase family DNA binding protein
MSTAAHGNPDDLLTERQAAELLTVSSRTLQSWRSDGLGPSFIRVGRSVRYPHKGLLEYLAENTVRSRRRK